MESNLENISTEIVETSTKTPAVAPEKPKKSKGLLAATIIFAILALAGIAFGVYGMYFNQPPKCITNCPDSNTSETTTEENPISNAPSISEVKKVLADKYGFKESRATFSQGLMSDSLWDHLDNFDDTAKLAYTVRMSEELLTEGEMLTTSPEVVRSISYDTLNERYKTYFGNTSDLPKNSQEISINYGGITRIIYSPESDTFDVYFAIGLGGTSAIQQLNKIAYISGSQEEFTATLLTVIVNALVTQSTGESLLTGRDIANGEYYYMTIPEDSIEEIRNSLSEYRLNFIKEDDDYKLISVEKP